MGNKLEFQEKEPRGYQSLIAKASMFNSGAVVKGFVFRS